MALVARKRRSPAGFDLTPLIDVVFQLLIFLMISSHFTRPESVVELPETAAAATLPDERKTIRITLLPDGGIEIDGKPVTREAFYDRIDSRVRDGAERAEFRGDQTARYGLFVELMEEAQDAGVASVGIVRKSQAEAGE